MILAWRARYESWGLVAVMQRFELSAGTDTAAISRLAATLPFQRLKISDAALRSRSEQETLGELGSERFRNAMQSMRQRRG